MKYVAVASSNRIQYLSRFMEHLKANDLSGWKVLISHDPTPGLKNAVDLVISNGFSSSVNETVLWCEHNTYKACSLSMDDPECDAVLYLDDDVLLSPDSISLCNWYLGRDIDPKEAGMCLMNEKSDPDLPNEVSSKMTFGGGWTLGSCFNRRQWEDFVKPNFWVRKPPWENRQHDWALGQMVLDLGRTFLRPRLSRTQHIGLEGVHGAAAGEHPDIFPKIVATGKHGPYVLN